MPTRYVTFSPNQYYHVYNRGSEKRTFFQSHGDYTSFLSRAKENSHKYAIDIICYCLMPNHFHFLLKQTTDVSIAYFMNAVQLGYAKYFNTKYQRVGPLFQGRYKAKNIESDEYLLQLTAYIHNNPLTTLADSGNTKDSRNHIHHALIEYPYSSYAEFIQPTTNMLSKPNFILEFFSTTYPQLSYKAFVEGYKPDYETLGAILANGYDIV